jgi:hypothetical protein
MRQMFVVAGRGRLGTALMTRLSDRELIALAADLRREVTA